MALENVSLTLVGWVIIITMGVVAIGPVLLRATRLRKYKIFPDSELRFLIRFVRAVSFIFFIGILIEFISGLFFGVGLLDRSAITITWYVNRLVFLFGFLTLMFLPRYILSISKIRYMKRIQKFHKLDGKSGIKSIDSVDWDILNSIKSHGGDIENIKSHITWLKEDEIERRLHKLYFLDYIKFGGFNTYLTPQALDILNYPPVLFASDIDDKHVIKKLVEIKQILKKENTHGVLNESSKLLEWVLKNRIRKSHKHVTKIASSGKPLDSGTLGELIGESRRLNTITSFEDHLMTAINGLRKNIHARSKRAEITLEQAYYCYILTETVIKSLYSKR